MYVAGFSRQLQSQASASAQQAFAQHRDTDDRDLAADLLIQLALGTGAFHRWLDFAVCWTRNRRQSTSVLQKPRLPFSWTTMAPAASGVRGWFSEAERVEVSHTSTKKIPPG